MLICTERCTVGAGVNTVERRQRAAAHAGERRPPSAPIIASNCALPYSPINIHFNTDSFLSNDVAPKPTFDHSERNGGRNRDRQHR